jgi:hypothetical protein
MSTVAPTVMTATATTMLIIIIIIIIIIDLIYNILVTVNSKIS